MRLHQARGRTFFTGTSKNTSSIYRMIESSEDLVVVIGAVAAAFTGCMAAIRLSKCVHINVCWGCLELKRKVKGADDERPETPRSVQV